MLSVVCFKWRARGAYPIAYTSEHVNDLQRMVARHYQEPHRFICVTDDEHGLDPQVEVVPLWDQYADLVNPCNPTSASCYVRLWAFTREAAALLGERFVWLDVDCMITRPMEPLWHRNEDFVIWSNPAAVAPYNGSMVLMSAGARAQVYHDFDPDRSPRIARAKGYYGSDQAWIAYCLGHNEATWSEADGVYSFRRHVRRTGKLPEDCRVVFFAGKNKPWDPEVKKRNRWIEQYRIAA